MAISDEQLAAHEAALREERRHYELHGPAERLADVDAELERLAPRKRAQRRPRRSSGAQTR